MIKQQITRADDLLSVPTLIEDAYSSWQLISIDFLEKAFGKGTSYIRSFTGVGWGGGLAINPTEAYRNNQRRDRLQSQKSRLEALMELLTTEIQLSEAPTVSTTTSFWDDLHHTVVRTAKQRYESGHFADSVEAAMKELNNSVKALVKRKTGKELDGASLMNTAFSPGNPIIPLEDLSTETGRNIQQGYMQIFAGGMIGIRNPKAHDNLDIDAQRARHLLYLASLLFFVLDERM